MTVSLLHRQHRGKYAVPINAPHTPHCLEVTLGMPVSAVGPLLGGGRLLGRSWATGGSVEDLGRSLRGMGGVNDFSHGPAWSGVERLVVVVWVPGGRGRKVSALYTGESAVSSCLRGVRPLVEGVCESSSVVVERAGVKGRWGVVGLATGQAPQREGGSLADLRPQGRVIGKL